MPKLIVVSVLICILVLVSFLFYNNSKNKVAIIKTTIHSECSLEKTPCKIFMPNGQALVFDLEPKGLPVMEPLILSVTGLGAIKSSLKAWFEGKSMAMGSHYLLPVSDTNRLIDEKVFKGMIPVCTIDNEMVWLLNVDIPIENQLFNIQFQLKPISGG